LVFITEMKSVYSAVRTGSLNKAVCACATYSINWLVFITEKKSVYSAVRTGYLKRSALRLQRFKLAREYEDLWIQRGHSRPKEERRYLKISTLQPGYKFTGIEPRYSAIPSGTLITILSNQVQYRPYMQGLANKCYPDYTSSKRSWHGTKRNVFSVCRNLPSPLYKPSTLSTFPTVIWSWGKENLRHQPLAPTAMSKHFPLKESVD
jgi:hypothetical protein